MRVAYNGSFWNQETTGSGQYLHHLLASFPAVSDAWQGLLCCPTSIGVSESPVQAVRGMPLSTPFDKRRPNLAKLWFEQTSFPRACRRENPDLVHIPYFAPPLFSPRPLVVTIFDLIPLLLPVYRGSTAVRAYMKLVSRAARRADLIITDSYSAARDIERLLKIDRERIYTVYLAASEAYRPADPVACEALLQRLGIEPPYLLYLGGFDRRKNVTGILRALASIRNDLRGTRLVIAGRLPGQDTPFAPDPRWVSSELGLGDCVQYTGWVAEEDKPALYSGALGFVFPSYYEGFGLPVLEAISCGTPAIVGTGSSLEEVAGEGGIPVAPGDVKALAQAMYRLIHDDTLRHELSQACLHQAERFSWNKTAEQTWLAYQQVLMRRGA